MKAKRIIALLLVTVLSLGVLASCGSSDSDSADAKLDALSISEIYKEGAKWNDLVESEDLTYTQISDYTFLAEKQIVRTSSNYVIYENTAVDPLKYVVYNLALEKEVCSVEASKVSDTWEDINCSKYYVTIMTTDENGKESTTVYSNKGDVLYKTDGDYSVDSMENFCRIGDKLYKKNYKDYTLTEIATLPAIWSEVEDLYILDDAYAVLHDNSVAYYNKTNFDFITAYVVPSNYDEFKLYLLGNGNVLIQTFTFLEDDEVEFDYYYSTDSISQKCNVDYYIYDYSDKTTEEVDFGSYLLIPYFLMNKNLHPFSEYGYEFYDFINNDVENAAYFCKIVNHRIDSTQSYIVSLDNDGTMVGYANSQVEYQYSVPDAWGEYFTVDTEFATYILDKNGKVLKQIHSDDVSFCDYGIYDFETEKIYNVNLELVKDLSKYEIIERNDKFVMYSEKDSEGKESYYFFSKAGTKKVTLPAGFELYYEFDYSSYDYSCYYEVLSDEIYRFSLYSYNGETQETKYKYYYYNNEGTFLFESTLDYDYYRTFDSFAIIKAYNSETGKDIYKKISVAAPAVTPTA